MQYDDIVNDALWSGVKEMQDQRETLAIQLATHERNSSNFRKLFGDQTFAQWAVRYVVASRALDLVLDLRWAVRHDREKWDALSTERERCRAVRDAAYGELRAAIVGLGITDYRDVLIAVTDVLKKGQVAK